MIIIINEHKTTVTSFASYWDVFQHIEHLEKSRQTRNPLLPDWSFTVHPYQRALQFHAYIEETLKTGIGAKDDRRALSILEVCQGNAGKVSLLPITPDLNVDALKEEWCQAYLRARGYFSLQPDDLPSVVKPW
jgi:hypothetical protein